MSDKKTDLIYAILAMDAYNRGYGRGMLGLNVDAQARLGAFSIVQNISQARWFERGFYALAYASATGTIVSIGGTDNKFSSEDPNLGGSDLTNGYGLALGFPGHGSYTTPIGGITITADQAVLAETFLSTVVSGATGPITLNGHSLGGGLAGYLGTTRGYETVLFDNMPFGIAAERRKPKVESRRVCCCAAWERASEISETREKLNFVNFSQAVAASMGAEDTPLTISYNPAYDGASR